MDMIHIQNSTKRTFHSEILMSRIIDDCEGRFHYRTNDSLPSCFETLKILKAGVLRTGLTIEIIPACSLFEHYQRVSFKKI